MGLAGWAVAGSAFAQAGDTADLGEVVVTAAFGPRPSPTANPDRPISADELRKRGGNDLQSLIKVAVPSLDAAAHRRRRAGLGAADHARPSTGQVLVLVNGKRRHTSADLNTSNQIGRGDVVMTSTPSRPPLAGSRCCGDGAAAQYGSTPSPA